VRPHLILEGPDCSGKTTIAHFLTENFGYAYQHEGPPPPDVSDLYLYYATKLQTIAWATQPVVFDRMFRGETIYGPIFRGINRLTKGHLHLLNRLCRARGVYQILCGPSLRVGLAAWSSRMESEMVKDPAVYENIWRAYQLSHYDFRVSTLTIPKHMYDFEARVLPPAYVGSPTAKILLVGDKPNGGELDLAFMSTENSSGFLNKCLYLAGYAESEMALVNAHSLNGGENEIRQYRNVIALGDEAARVCAGQGIRGRKIPHPSYWRRFHAADEAKYIENLRKVKHDH
jgi:hypothetical protein